jgi:hypothetical protein
MKKSIVFVSMLLIATALFAQTKMYYYPAKGKPIISMSVPATTWTVSNESSYMSLQPEDKSNDGRLIAMMWESSNPGAEDAVTSLVNESFELVETLLSDITWKDETTDFQINGIDFVGIDGWGNYVNKDGSKDEMMVSVSIFFPDDNNLMAFVFFGLNSAYDKHGEELLNIMMSIKSSR